jgi:hypothetical protein
MRPDYVVFLNAVSATAAALVGLLFFRFWHESEDRLFGFFSAAFWLMALCWALLGLASPTDETRPYIYAIRLLAFLLIIVGIIDKNRGRS